MKKGLFRRIFFLYGIVLILSIFFIEIYITDTVRNNYNNSLRKDLSIRIALISGDIPFGGDYHAFCKEIKTKTGDRVTVIANDGKVLGDSDGDLAVMENHYMRPEIQQAILEGEGMSIRLSDTLKHDFMYVAGKVSQNGRQQGFLRLAVPLVEIDKAVNLLRTKLILIVALVLAFGGLVSLWQTDLLRRLLLQVAEYSKSLAGGDIDRKLFLKTGGEFDLISDNLNAMSEKLRSVIAVHEEEKERLNVILRSVPDALLIINPDGIVQLSSTTSAEFFGEGRIAGRHFMEVVRSHEFSELVEEVKNSRVSGVTDLRLDQPVEKYLSVRLSPLFYTGDALSGFVAVFHDITQRERLEQVRKDFIANVSHEIKTPVTSIKGFADTLLEGALEDKDNALKFIRTIKANSERLNGLVDDLMIISKIELGVIKVEKSSVDVEEITEGVRMMLAEKAGAKNLYLKVVVNQDLKTVSADRDRLTQIYINLVDNAIKFTETGGVTFGADVENGRDVLFVEDTGIGVPQKHLPRLGERFYRVDPARSRKMGGTGLGLAIVKHLVKAHGWELNIESSAGKGTKVKILI
jgi:two-component system phosphate regulon sensor histidine kinase PhoR